MNVPSHPVDPRDDASGADRPVTIERFAARGKRARDTGVVILLHDANGPGPDRPVRGEAAALAQAGFRVLLPHYLGRTGQHRVGFSDIARNFSAWRGAVADVLDRAEAEGGPGRIALVGRSLGGALALAVAARAPTRIAALVVRAAFLPPALGDGPLALPPVLALHGARDVIVGPRNAETLRSRVMAAGGSARVHLYPDQAHTFDAGAEADAVARGIAYLKDHLR